MKTRLSVFFLPVERDVADPERSRRFADDEFELPGSDSAEREDAPVSDTVSRRDLLSVRQDPERPDALAFCDVLADREIGKGRLPVRGQRDAAVDWFRPFREDRRLSEGLPEQLSEADELILVFEIALRGDRHRL